jgi:hypothetical protein
MMPTEPPTDADGRPLVLPRLLTRERYLALLAWAFALFASVRVLSYLPTLWAIVQARDSSQHSLLTWATWLGANLTMAAWLHEHGGPGSRGAARVSLLNAAMCALVLGAVLGCR